MTIRTKLPAISLVMALASPLALAGSPPVPSTWAITPTPGQTNGIPGSVAFSAKGAGTATQGPVRKITVRWFQGQQDSYFWYLMDEKKTPFQAFRYSPSQGGGYSCAVDKMQPSGDFKCTDNGYNFTMTRASGK